MSVFEDLVEALKEDNLIEETVIETSRAEENSAGKTLQPAPVASEKAADKNASTQNLQSVIPAEKTAAISKDGNNQSKESKTQNTVSDSTPENLQAQNSYSTSLNTETAGESDFYRRRATEEVTSLKIVEHIISGVEREMMKIAPKSYDDLAVGIALHDFLHITAEPESSEHSLSEFKLMQETENWYSALAHRDKFIAVGDLRRYCETTRPVLSLQALIALARFYRNAPFSETVRSKFDMVMTRLLTKETRNNKRQMVFERQNLVAQITGLYQDWSSIPLYAGEDDSEVLIAVLKFEDFISEIEKTDSFEELVRKDFFNRLRIFKDSTGENFFSPLLLATAIECNVIVGNRYIELIEAEREKNNSEILEAKYQSLLDLTVSDATSKTLQLVELLHSVREPDDEAVEPEVQEEIIPNASKKPEKSKQQTVVAEKQKAKFVSFRINKWLLLTAVFVLISTGGLYVWVEHFTASQAISAGVEKVDLEGTPLEEYFKAARINDNTFYAITQAGWRDLAKETKEDVLKKTLADGAKNGYTKIIVLNGEGKTIGFASPQKGIEISDF